MISGGMAAEFVHLHVHSQYSFLVSTVPLGALPERTEALGQGAGRALLGVLVERCAGPGYRRIIGVIGDSDNTASIKLYEAVGFRQAGLLRSVGYKHGRWLGSVFMQRDLGHGDPAPPDRI